MSQFNKTTFNSYVHHPLQSFEWGDFRTKTGIKVIRRFVDNVKDPLAFQLTIHQIPHTPWSVGYLPKGTAPSSLLIQELIEIGKQEKCIFIQLEPHVQKDSGFQIKNLPLTPSARPLFTKYTFILDLTQSDEELLKNCHPKTRYNIRVAQKHKVVVKNDNSKKAFKEYLQLTEETTRRQKFYAHGPRYHTLMWETLQQNGNKINPNELSAHLLTASYNKKVLTAWVVFIFKDTLYYPYGASSSEHREVMASNLMMWEAIQFGKKNGLKKFDMWGALSENPDTSDPWYGFHRFKQGYGPRLVEFVGSYDLVINPLLYQGFKTMNAARWLLLRLKK